MSSLFPKLLLVSALIALPLFGWWLYRASDGARPPFPNGASVLRAGRDFRVEDGGKKVSGIPDSGALDAFDRLKTAFRSLDFSLASDTALPAGDIARNARGSADRTTLTSDYALGDVTVETGYRDGKSVSMDGYQPVEQAFTIRNRATRERTVTLASRMEIAGDAVLWDGKPYPLTETRQTFAAYAKTASVPDFAKDAGKADTPGLEAFKNYTHTYTVGSSLTFDGGGHPARYDWTDALPFHPEVVAYREGGKSFIEFTVRDVTVPAGGETVIDPNLGLNNASAYDVRYDGSTVLPNLATSLAVGDVNGDGVPDLVLGSPSASYSGLNYGSVFVVFGGAGLATGNRPFDVATDYNIRYDGASAGQFAVLGSVVIGDVNGDGHPDLVLGAGGATFNGSQSGSVYIIFSTLIATLGSTTGNVEPLSTATNYNIRYDGAVNDGLSVGNESIVIGDVNGDGVSDLVLGAPYGSNSAASSGSVYVIFSALVASVGSSTGNIELLNVATNYNIRYDGAASDRLTYSSCAVVIGDINGDGVPDLVISADYAYNHGIQSGSAYVIFSALVSAVGSSTGNVEPLSTAGNYNIRYDGAAANDYLTGSYGTVIGDVNGDGHPDLILGSYNASNNGATSGSVWVMFSTLISTVGSTTGNIEPLSTATNYNIRYDGCAASADLAFNGYASAIVIGDVNGDGVPDLVLGEYQSSNNGAASGSAYVIFSALVSAVGSTTGNIKPLNVATNYNIRYDGNGNAGHYLTSGGIAIGDVNGDGLPDLVLGALGAGNNGTTSSGSAFVIFSALISGVGSTTGNNKPISTTTNYNIRYDGAATNDSLTVSGGIALSDINGDGHPDLVLGADGASNNGATSGSAYVMFSTLVAGVGSTTGNNKQLNTGANYTARYDGSNPLVNLANVPFAIGDVNGDGKPDLIIGAYNATYNGGIPSTNASGSALVIFGGTKTTGNKPLDIATNYNIRYDGAAAGNMLTYNAYWSTIAIGDVNGDGHPDLVLGAYSAGGNAGSAYVMFSTLISAVGSTTGNIKPLNVATNYNIRYDGVASSYFASNIAIGDVNGDNLPDLVIGAPYASSNGSNSGSAYVMFSTLISVVGSTTGNNKPLSTATNYNIRYDGAAAGNYLIFYGEIAIGDINGDGHPDLVLGAHNAAYNGASSGSAWVIFSTLISAVGATTGNNKPLNTAGNYNIRYDSASAGDFLTYYGDITIGDINGDGHPDLVLGATQAGNNGANSGSAFVIFSTLIAGVGVTTGNIESLNTATNYNIRYDGAAAGNFLTRGGIVIGDINGDGHPDLVLGTDGASNNGANSGSAYVIFSTLVSGVGSSTGNIEPLSTATNYNIRWDGAAVNNQLTAGHSIVIGDVNGDGVSDLVLGAPPASNNGAGSGSAYVISSTLISAVGSTTGNNKPLSTAGNYNIRYDGDAASDQLASGGTLAIGDVNGDGHPDLVLGSSQADNRGSNSGSVWMMFGGANVGRIPDYSFQGALNIQGPATFQ